MQHLYKYENFGTIKNYTIVTEDQFQANFLKQLLETENFKNQYEILPSDGYSDAISKIRSRISRGGDFILVTNTNSTQEVAIKEKMSNLRIMFGNDSKFHPVLAVPEFEVIFLENPEFVSEYLDNMDPRTLELRKQFPKLALTKLSLSEQDFISSLSDPTIRDAYFQTSVVKQICDLLGN